MEEVNRLAAEIADKLAEKGFHRDCGNNNRLVIEHELETMEEVISLAALRPFITPASTPPAGISQTEWPCGMVLCSHIGCKPLGNDSDILACGHQRKWQIATFDKDDTPDGGSECARCKIDGLPQTATPTESVREQGSAKAARLITIMVDKWLEKMNLPTSNKEGKEIFTQTIQDIIEQCASPSVPLLDVDGQEFKDLVGRVKSTIKHDLDPDGLLDSQAETIAEFCRKEILARETMLGGVRSTAWSAYQVLGCLYGIGGPARIMNWFYDIAHGEMRDTSELFPITTEEREKYQFFERQKGA